MSTRTEKWLHCTLVADDLSTARPITCTKGTPPKKKNVFFRAFKLEKVNLQKGRYSGVPPALRTPLLRFPIARRAFPRLHLWSSHQ